MTGDELKARRAALGLSQAKLAVLLGVQVNTVSRWERGALKVPALLDLALQKLECRRLEETPE